MKTPPDLKHLKNVEDNQRSLNTLFQFVSASNGNQNRQIPPQPKKGQEKVLSLIACSEAFEAFNTFSQLRQTRPTLNQ